MEDGEASTDLPSSANLIETSAIENRKDILNKEKVKTNRRAGNISFPTAIKLAKYSFGKNPIKVIISLIAAIFIFATSALLLPLFIQDYNFALSETLKNAEYKNIIVNDYDPPNNQEYYDQTMKKFDGIISKIHRVRFDIPYEYLKDVKYPVGFNISWVVELKEQKALDIKVVSGDYPSKVNELIIALSTANTIIQSGRKINDKNIKYNSIDDLIGEPMFVKNDGSVTVIISGIFDDCYDALANRFREDSDEESYYGQNFLAYTAVGMDGVGDFILTNHLTSISRESAEIYVQDELISYEGYDASKGYSIPQLLESEVSISAENASSLGINVGDTITLNFNLQQQTVQKEFNVVSIHNSDDSNSSIVVNTVDYKKHCVFISTISNEYIINLKDTDTYSLLKKIDKYFFLDREDSKLLYNNVTAMNNNKTQEFYSNVAEYKYILILPLAIMVTLGVALLAVYSLSYLLSSKDKTYHILRAIGFNKSSVFLIMILQTLVISIVQCALGIALGAVLCHIFSRAFVVKVSTEVLLPLGWQGPLIICIIAISSAFLTALVKLWGVYRKSISEYDVK